MSTLTVNPVTGKLDLISVEDISSLVSGSGTPTQIAYWASASSISSNSNLDWDNTNSIFKITGSTAQARLISSGDSNNTRLTRVDTSGKAVRYNIVAKPSSIIYSLSYNGSNQYGSTGNAANIQIGTGTISAWIKTSGAGASFRGILVKQNAYGMFLVDNSFAIYDWGGGATRDSGVTLNNNSWHHVAVTFDSGVSNGTKLYSDGILRLTTTMTVSNQNDGIAIASGATGGGQNFNGKIAYYRVYSRILSGSEITDLANGAEPSTSNLISTWKQTEGSGSTINDSTDSNSVTLSNSPSWDTDKPSQISDPSSDVEIVVWSSEDGTNAGDEGLQKLGWYNGKTNIRFGSALDFVTGSSEVIVGRLSTSGQWLLNTTTTTDPITGSSLFRVADGNMILSFKDNSSGAGWLAVSNGTITGFTGHTNSTDGFVIGSYSNHKLTLRANSNRNSLQIQANGKIIIQDTTDGNSDTAGAKIDIRTDVASYIGLIIKGASSQSADLLQVLDSSANILNHIASNGKQFIGGSTAPTALLHLAAGTASANTAPLKLTSGTNLTTAEAGAVEFNGTNLFFTRTGTTRENVLVAVDNVSAPSTSIGVGIVNYYGSAATNFLGDPNRWLSVNVLGSVYKVPLYT